MPSIRSRHRFLLTTALLVGAAFQAPAWAHGDVTPQAVDTSSLPKLGDAWRTENPYRKNEAAIKVGSSAYNQNCARCHGLEAISGGIAPDQVDVVCATHAHCDHIWALVNAKGQRVFPNARVAISEADLRFWTDDGNKRGPSFMPVFIDGAKKNLSAYRDRMIMVRDGQEVVPGVTAIAAPSAPRYSAARPGPPAAHSSGGACCVPSSGPSTV